MKGIVLAGTRSGVGKTVATLVAIRALRRAGYDVQPAKAGPDFIDPTHHEAVAGRPSRALDPWLQGPSGVRRNYHRGRGDVCVVEGMMGLYDGSAVSTADVAAALDLPVVLVADAAAGMQSVAATALGFRRYASHADVDVDVVGVIAQRAHGGRHEAGIRDALPESIEYLGRIPPDESLEIPDRHLGLFMADEAGPDPDALDGAAETLAVDRLVELMRAPPRPERTDDSGRNGDVSGPTIAVARDEAFCFRYPATAERLRSLASVTTFSPVAGDDLPPCSAVYLPGGYPERYTEALEGSTALGTIADRAADGMPVLAECGGMMALAESLETVDGDRHRMAGVLPVGVTMHDRYQALDHVELRAVRETPAAAEGRTVRGHEFHYSSVEADGDVRYAYETVRGRGIDGDHDGILEYRTLGTYAHLHAESGVFDRFVECAR